MASSRRSAGILLYRRKAGRVEVLLAHAGGPFWAKKDLGAWTIPKGELGDGEEALAGARREFEEETGLAMGAPVIELGDVRQKSGKHVAAWAAEGDADVGALRSNTFTMEWPPRSGRTSEFPEIDRWEWFDLAEAARRVHPAQVAFLERLAERIS